MADTQQAHSTDELVGPVATPVPAPVRNGLGLASFIVGVAGLLGSLSPFLTLVFAPVAVLALVLGIVALRIKGRQRAFAIAGTAVSGVTVLVTIVYGVVFPLLLTSGVADRVPESPLQGIGPTVSGGDGAPGSLGSRERPMPIGTSVQVDSTAGLIDWEVTLGQPMLDADDVIAAYSESNEPAPEGFQYAMVPVTVVYLGTETGTPWADLALDFVSPAGTAHSSSDSFAVAPQPLTDLNRLAPGEGGTGNVVVAVPSADVENGMWVVSTMLGDQYFFEAR